MRIMTALAIVLGGIALPLSAPAAERLAFQDIWGRIQEQSAAVQAAGKEADAAALAAKRAGRHWYPKLVLDTRAYSTNDPALTFFSLLGERRAGAADFASDQLNHPGSSFFEKGSLVLDLPLYEGGQKEALADSAGLAAAAKATARDATLQGELAQTARDYSLILSTRSEARGLSELAGRVDALLLRYELGSKSNPVGYAGALGLKSLRARIAGLLERNRAAEQGLSEALSVRAGMDPTAWEPENVPFAEVLNQALPDAAGGSPSSLYARALLEGSQAAERAGDAEGARFLPKAGVFVQGDLTNGGRATGTSYATGAYLQWQLFDAPSYGAREQAGLEAGALRLRAEQQAQADRISRTQAQGTLRALEANLKLLGESLDLSDEQIRTSETLFRNGSINALQLAEVLSRRVDLLLARSEAEGQMVEMRVLNFVSSGAAGEGSHDS